MSYSYHSSSQLHSSSFAGALQTRKSVSSTARPLRLGSITDSHIIPRRVASLTDSVVPCRGEVVRPSYPRASLPQQQRHPPQLHVVDCTQSQRQMLSTSCSRSWTNCNMSDSTQTQQSLTRLSAPQPLTTTAIAHPHHGPLGLTQESGEQDKAVLAICSRLQMIQSKIMEDAYDNSHIGGDPLAGLHEECQHLRRLSENCVALRRKNVELLQAIVASVERSSLQRRRKAQASHKDVAESGKRQSPFVMSRPDAAVVASAPPPIPSLLAKRLMASLPGQRPPLQVGEPSTLSSVVGIAPKKNLLLLAREGGSPSDDNLFDI